MKTLRTGCSTSMLLVMTMTVGKVIGGYLQQLGLLSLHRV